MNENLQLLIFQKQPSVDVCSYMFFEICVVENFAKFTGKHLCQSLFLVKLQASTSHGTGVSSEFCEIFKCNFLKKIPPSGCLQFLTSSKFACLKFQLNVRMIVLKLQNRKTFLNHAPISQKKSRHFEVDTRVKHTKIHFNTSTKFQKLFDPLVYQILAKMLSLFEKLKPVIKDIKISDCTFDDKKHFQFLGPKRPVSKRPIFRRPGVQIPSIQVPRVQAYSLYEQNSAFPVCPLRKL